MATNKSGYVTKYKREKLKRVPLEVKKEFYDSLKAAADSSGMSVNGFIKIAIKEKMEIGMPGE